MIQVGLGEGAPFMQPWGSHHPCWMETFDVAALGIHMLW